jgi:hypothetical protein
MRVPSKPDPRVNRTAMPRSQPVHASAEDALRASGTYSDELGGVTTTWAMAFHGGTWGVTRQPNGGRAETVASGLDEGEAIYAALNDIDKTRRALSPQRKAAHSPPASLRHELATSRSPQQPDAAEGEQDDEGEIQPDEPLLWRLGRIYPAAVGQMSRPAVVTAVRDTHTGPVVTVSPLAVLRPDGQPDRPIPTKYLIAMPVWDGSGDQPKVPCFVPNDLATTAFSSAHLAALDDLRAEFDEFKNTVGTSLRLAAQEMARMAARMKVLEGVDAFADGRAVAAGNGKPVTIEDNTEPDPEPESNAGELTYAADDIAQAPPRGPKPGAVRQAMKPTQRNQKPTTSKGAGGRRR